MTPFSPDDDARFMREALRHAELAARSGEVPIGAVAVRNGGIVAADATGSRNCIR